MEIGIFVVPFRQPSTNVSQGFEWDLQLTRWSEEYGLSEVWFGEHFTIGWEPCCAPELMIASALRETQNIVLAAGAHLLPYHNPVALAHRLMMLDHLARGRLIVGVGAGAFSTDKQLFGVQDNREMMAEALEIIQAIWTADEPFTINGKYWSVDYPPYDDLLRGPHWKPFQKPHPPIAMAGFSPASSTLYEAGKKGFMPMSVNIAPEFLAGQWYRYVEGAEESGKVADRNRWRVSHYVFVADTDEEAYRLAVNSFMGRAFAEFLLPQFRAAGMMPIMAPDVEPQDVTVDYLARNRWLLGSPDTVVEQLHRLLDASGGFGTLLAITFDHRDDPEPYRRNLELLATEVLPRVKHIQCDTEPLSALAPPADVQGVSWG